MRNIESLRDSLITKYSDNIALTSKEVEVILDIILEEFSYDFPVLKGKYIPEVRNRYKIYLDEISNNLIEIKGVLYKSDVIGNLQTDRYLESVILSKNMAKLDEIAAISLYKNAISLFSYKDILYKPVILSDTTTIDMTSVFGINPIEVEREFIILNEPGIVFFTEKRIINKDYIPENIYKILINYIYGKFLSQYLSEVLETSSTTRLRIINMISEFLKNIPGYDGTSQPEDIIRSISVGSISISFDEKDARLKTLSDILTRMLSSSQIELTTINYLKEEAQKYLNKFKKQKILYFSGNM